MRSQLFAEGLLGHMARYVSQGFSLLLQLGENITATVVSTKRYSRDLPQGGLEISCQYIRTS